MAVPFDHIASVYESVLSRTAMGQLQRKEVWNYLQRIFPQFDELEILELTWGSDEDAMMFSDKGYNIIATDISLELQNLTRERAHSYGSRISSQYLDLDADYDSSLYKKYDLIISNFGGMNCINPQAIQKLLTKLPGMLKPGGRFIGVIMTRYCLFESLYHLVKFRFKRAFRRWSNEEVNLRVNGCSVKTWFYSPSSIIRWAGGFDLVRLKPIGVVLPPVYLTSFLLRKKWLLLKLNILEKQLNKFAFFSEIADHFIIDLKVK